MEFGIFNDEGMIEGDFSSRADAEIVAQRDYYEDDVTIHEICHDHPEHARESCEDCHDDEAEQAIEDQATEDEE